MEGCTANGGEQKLLCGACKTAPAKVFSAAERQVYCWRCDEAAHSGELGNTCPRYLVVDSPLPAGSQPTESVRHSGAGVCPTSGCSVNDVFANWPSDSEESLLVEFTQGLAPGFTGDSELLQLDWLSGGSLLKPGKHCTDDKSDEFGGSHVEDLTTGPSISSIDGSFGLTMQPSMENSHPVLQQTEGLGESTVNSPLMGTTGIAPGSTIGPLPFGVDLVTQKLPGMVVPGVPCGMVPVTVPSRFCRRHSIDDLDSIGDLRRHTRKRGRSIRDHSSLLSVVHTRTSSMPNDLEMAAARMRHRELGTASCVSPQRRCTHCGASKTPQWRAGPYGQKTLCNACGVKYKAGRLNSCGSPSGRGRRAGHLISQRKAVLAAESRGL